MILSETLVGVLYLVLIIAVCMLTAVFWRLFDILGDIKKTTERIDRRTKQLDEMAENIINSLKGSVDAIKGFLYSLDLVKTIRKKINPSEDGISKE